MKRSLNVLLSITLFLIVLSFYVRLLLDCPLLPGIDGPYYAVQVSYIIKTGSLKYPDPPFAFYAMYLCALVCGDVFLAVKVTTSILTALSVIPLFFSIVYITKSRVIATLSSVVYSLSFYVLRMMSDFMKNSIGMLWLNLGLLTLVMFMVHKLERRTFVIAYTISLFLTGITHILDFWTLIVYSVAITLLWFFIATDKRKSRFALKSVLTVQAGVLTTFFVCATLFTGGDIFKVLSLARDLIRFTPMVFSEFHVRFLLSPKILVPMFITSLLILMCLITKVREVVLVMALSSIAMTIILNLSPLPPSWIMRLNLMSCIPLSIMVGTLVHIMAKSTRFVTAIFLTFLSLLPLTFIVDKFRPRPSIPPAAYGELKRVILHMNDEHTLWVVPDTRIRYWVETIIDNVVRTPRALPSYKCKVLFIASKFPRGRPIRAKIVYDGMFFNVYRLR